MLLPERAFSLSSSSTVGALCPFSALFWKSSRHSQSLEATLFIWMAAGTSLILVCCGWRAGIAA